MAAADGKSLFDQLLEEAAQRGQAAAQAEDFAVDLSVTDADGTYSISGVPLSKVGKQIRAKFGIGTEDGDDGDAGDGSDQGQGGTGKPGPKRAPRQQSGQGGQAGGLRNLFPQGGQKAAGS